MQNQTIRFSNEFVPENMIEVAMGIDQFHGIKRIGVNKFPQLLLFFRKITSRINDNAVQLLIVKHISVLLYRTESEVFYGNHDIVNILKMILRISPKRLILGII